MRRRIVALTLVFVLIMSMAVYAAEPRTPQVTPRLSFSGTTANCSVSVNEYGSDIFVTLTLYRGWSTIASWSGSGSGYVNVSGTAAVKDGLEYKLVATGTVDGVAFTSVEVWGTC